MTQLPRSAIPLAAALALSLAACMGQGRTQADDGKIAGAVSAAAARLEAGQPLDGHLARSDAQGRLEVYVYLTGAPEEPAPALSASGLEGITFNRDMGIAQGWIGPADLKALAALPMVRRITLPQYAQPR